MERILHCNVDGPFVRACHIPGLSGQHSHTGLYMHDEARDREYRDARDHWREDR